MRSKVMTIAHHRDIEYIRYIRGNAGGSAVTPEREFSAVTDLADGSATWRTAAIRSRCGDKRMKHRLRRQTLRRHDVTST